MRYLISLLISLTSAQALANVQSSVRLGALIESNTYYLDQTDAGAISSTVEPSLEYEKSLSQRLTVGADVKATAAKYIGRDNQDYFEYDVKGKLDITYKSFGVYLLPKANFESEPALNKSSDRLGRTFFGGTFGTWVQTDRLRKLTLRASYIQESLDQEYFTYLDNMDISGELEYRYSFLPETDLVIVGKGGTRTFPDGLANTHPISTRDKKYDSVFFEVGGGVEGRLTRKLKIRSYAGFLHRTYEQESGFKEPLFKVEFEEERSPKDMIILGYDYYVEDSYFTNYVLNQKMYIGFGRIYGDQLLLLPKVSYHYRSFSRPYRREDQRITGALQVEYSMRRNLKLESYLEFDILTSDAFEGSGLNPLDPAVSYENIKLGFYLKYVM